MSAAQYLANYGASAAANAACAPGPGRSAGTPAMVWVRSLGKATKAAPYTAGKVVGQEESGRVRVMLTGSTASESVLLGEADLVPRNPSGNRPDNCQLLHLNEACVLENIAARFDQGEIYTWTSHVLTAVNPYEPLPLYSDARAADLPGLAPRDLPPHAFSVAELAMRGVTRAPQAIVVSGESGAGKTTNMAHVMAYLTKRAQNTGTADGGLGVRLGTLLLQSNPVLEAFGNAQTVRNHNSSRFGKYIRVRAPHPVLASSCRVSPHCLKKSSTILTSAAAAELCALARCRRRSYLMRAGREFAR